MDPYKMLNKIAEARSINAVLTDAKGAVKAHIKIKPEDASTEALASDYQGAVPVRVWSYVPIDDIRPDAGDTLLVSWRGADIVYKCARSSPTGRYWDAFFIGDLERVKFYTATNGTRVYKEVNND